MSEYLHFENFTEHGTFVTRGEEGQVSVAGGTIRLVPAWRFLFDMSNM